MSNHDTNMYLLIVATVLAVIVLLANLVSISYQRGFMAGLKAGKQ